MRQYMPNKLIKWGFKLWVLATSAASSTGKSDKIAAESRRTTEDNFA